MAESVNSDDEDFDGEPKAVCTLCRKSFSGIMPLKQHIMGSQHKKVETKAYMKTKYKAASEKMKTVDVKHTNLQPAVANEAENDEVEAFPCEVCKKICTGYVPFQNHLTGKSHAKEIRKQKLLEKMKNSNILPSHSNKPKDNTLYDTVPQLKPFAACSVCKKSFSGPEHYQIHLESQIHKKALQNKTIVDDLVQEGLEVKKEVEDGNELMVSQNFFAVCKDCKKGFSGPIPYKQHIASNAHQKQKKKNILLDQLMKQFPQMLSKDNVKDIADDSDSEDDLYCPDCHACFTGPESARDHFLSKKHKKILKEKARRKQMMQSRDTLAKEKSATGNDPAPITRGFSTCKQDQPGGSTVSENVHLTSQDKKDDSENDDFLLL